jgi:hypothetical protein
MHNIDTQTKKINCILPPQRAGHHQACTPSSWGGGCGAA